MTGVRRRTVSTGYVRTLLDAFTKEYGGRIRITREDVLAHGGIPGDVLDDPEGRVPVEAATRVWALVRERSKDRLLGLKVGQHIRPGSFSVLGHLAMTSATLEEALSKAAEFAALVGDGGVLAMGTRDGDAVLAYDLVDRDLPCREERIEGILAAVVSFVRWITGRPVAPREVRFAHPCPGHREAFRAAFGLDPRFDQADNAVVIAAEDLGLPLVQADATLSALLGEHAKKVLSRITEEDRLVLLVRQRVMAQMASGPPTLEETARSLGMTPRSLQRRLADRGTTFQEQLTAARRSTALDHLRRRNRSIGEVALLSGFSDAASFHRAFKRWTGMTPSQWLEETSVRGAAS